MLLPTGMGFLFFRVDCDQASSVAAALCLHTRDHRRVAFKKATIVDSLVYPNGFLLEWWLELTTLRCELNMCSSLKIGRRFRYFKPTK